jgi:hypothetical protein
MGSVLSRNEPSDEPGTIQTVVWLVAWGVLHTRWKRREIAPRRIYGVTLILIGLGILATFPPVWGLL